MSYDWSARLVQLSMLKPGWDGYDAPTPSPEALDVAFYLLNGEHPGREFLTRLSPSVQGGVGITFKNTKRGDYHKVYLEIDQGGCAAAMFVNDEKIETCAVEDDFEGREKFYLQMQTFLTGEQS